MLAPADRARRGPVEAVPLPEDEAAAETPGRLHAEPLRRRPERAGDVGEVIGDLLLRDPDEARELVGSARTLAEMAEERFTDGDRALCRRALASRRSHLARVAHFGSIGVLVRNLLVVTPALADGLAPPSPREVGADREAAGAVTCGPCQSLGPSSRPVR